MNQNQHAQDQQPASRLLEAITVSALPPTFAHADIESRYNEGVYVRRLDAELDDILRNCDQESREEQPLSLHQPDEIEALRKLSCIALIGDGQALPLVDLSQVSEVKTARDKIRLYQSMARTLLDVVEALLDESGRFQDDDDAGACSPR